MWDWENVIRKNCERVSLQHLTELLLNCYMLFYITSCITCYTMETIFYKKMGRGDKYMIGTTCSRLGLRHDYIGVGTTRPGKTWKPANHDCVNFFIYSKYIEFRLHGVWVEGKKYLANQDRGEGGLHQCLTILRVKILNIQVLFSYGNILITPYYHF